VGTEAVGRGEAVIAELKCSGAKLCNGGHGVGNKKEHRQTSRRNTKKEKAETQDLPVKKIRRTDVWALSGGQGKEGLSNHSGSSEAEEKKSRGEHRHQKKKAKKI